MLLLLVVSCAFLCNVFSAQMLISGKEESEVLIEIISQFPDYNTVLHFDEHTVHNLEGLIKYVPGFTTIMNYDKENIPSRHIGYHFLNIVYLEDITKFKKFSEDHHNIKFQDIILIITQTNNTALPWEFKNINKSKGVFIFDIFNETLYHKCFYCGEKGTNVQLIARHTDVRSYLNEYNNFHGHHFNIGYMQFEPFFRCHTLIGCHGPEANLLHHMSKTLNFEYSLTNFKYVNGEGKWKILVNAVHNGVLDWGIGGVSLTPERRFLVDMTQTIHSESYRIMYRCTLSENMWSSWQQIVKPFRLDLWICFLCVLLISVLLLKYIPEYAVPSQVRSFFHYFTVIARLMLEQPVVRFPINSITKRIILINWCLACIILVTIYKSKIVSMLIESYYVEYNSLEDLLKNGYTFLVSNLDWSVLKEDWEAAMESDGQYQDIIRKTSNNLSTCEAVEKVTNNKVAYIDEMTTLLYQVINDCKMNITPQEFYELCLTKNKVYSSNHVWALQLGAPYGEKFSEVIDHLHSAGILTFWYNSVINDLLSRTKLQPSVPEINGLNLTTMTFPITILVSGWILSLLVLFGEILIHKLFELRKIRCNKVGVMKKFAWSD